MEEFLMGSAIIIVLGLLILMLIFWVKYKKPKRSNKADTEHTSNGNHESKDKHAKESHDHSHENDHGHGHGGKKSWFPWKLFGYTIVISFVFFCLWFIGCPPFNGPSAFKIVLWEFILK